MEGFGKFRKIGLGLSLATILPWLFIVVGFALISVAVGRAPVGTGFFPYWLISLGGIPLIILASVHAIVSSPTPAKILRIVITIASAVFLLCLGMMFYDSGGAIVSGTTLRLGVFGHGANLLFTGALLSTLIWVGQTVLWVFYEEPEGVVN